MLILMLVFFPIDMCKNCWLGLSVEFHRSHGMIGAHFTKKSSICHDNYYLSIYVYFLVDQR